MESKTLKTIQVFSKIGKVLSKIIFICSIVGACGCLVGIISLAVGMTESLELGGVTIHAMIEKSAEMSIGTMIAADIAYQIMNHYFTAVADLHIDDCESVGLEVTFILVSFLCKYGAEQIHNQND